MARTFSPGGGNDHLRALALSCFHERRADLLRCFSRVAPERRLPDDTVPCLIRAEAQLSQSRTPGFKIRPSNESTQVSDGPLSKIACRTAADHPSGRRQDIARSKFTRNGRWIGRHRRRKEPSIIPVQGLVRKRREWCCNTKALFRGPTASGLQSAAPFSESRLPATPNILGEAQDVGQHAGRRHRPAAPAPRTTIGYSL